MKSLTVHAALLVAALVLAFITWTAGNAPQADANLVEIWDRDPVRLLSATFQSVPRTLVLERRDRGGRSYLWGVETTRPQLPPRADSSGRDRTAAPAAPLPQAPAQVDQYPIGEQGTAVVEKLARLHALRDLGKPNAEERAAYGLGNAGDTLTLSFRGGEKRVLVIGGTVVGGGDRYVLDRKVGHVYVLEADLIQAFQVPGALRLAKLQEFAAEDVRRVVLRADGTERVMEREPTAGPPYALWKAPGSAQPDQAFANFMGQLDGLWVTQYRPAVNPDTLQAILRVDFLDARGDTLGTFELFRTRTPGPVTWYVRTSASIVAGEAYGPVAERIEQDVRTLFGGRRTTALTGAP